MSKTILVTVSDDRFGRKDGSYRYTQLKIDTYLSGLGISEHHKYTIDDIFKLDLTLDQKILLLQKDAAINGRLYKPLAILNSLQQLEVGDYLIYNDCSPDIWNISDNWYHRDVFSLDIIRQLCDSTHGLLSTFVKWDTRPIRSNELGIHIHKYFTTDRCIKRMTCQQYRNCYQHASGMMVFKKTNTVMEFMLSWIYYNSIADCASLGNPLLENDYSFWDKEDEIKIGHRHDQSISGLLINSVGYKLVDIVRHSEIPTSNFINFCRRNYDYIFINPNQECNLTGRIMKGDSVINTANETLKVFEVRPENNIEWLIVGKHRESCYRTTVDQLQLIKKQQ